MKPPRPTFAAALRRTRRARGLAQEVFDEVSSRTYISSLERGLKQPTLPKVDELSQVLGVHPLTLVALSYGWSPAEIDSILARVRQEVAAVCERSDPQGR